MKLNYKSLKLGGVCWAELLSVVVNRENTSLLLNPPFTQGGRSGICLLREKRHRFFMLFFDLTRLCFCLRSLSEFAIYPVLQFVFRITRLEFYRSILHGAYVIVIQLVSC